MSGTMQTISSDGLTSIIFYTDMDFSKKMLEFECNFVQGLNQNILLNSNTHKVVAKCICGWKQDAIFLLLLLLLLPLNRREGLTQPTANVTGSKHCDWLGVFWRQQWAGLVYHFLEWGEEETCCSRINITLKRKLLLYLLLVMKIFLRNHFVEYFQFEFTSKTAPFKVQISDVDVSLFAHWSRICDPSWK